MNPGAAGVEVYPNCYGSPSPCAWQLVGDSFDIPALSNDRIDISPTVTPHFNPKYIYMFGIDPQNPGTNLRFTVGAVTIGGVSQLAIFNPTPTGVNDLLSDVFNRSDEPIIVSNWYVFSTPGLGSPLAIDVFNLNPITLRVFFALWGNAIDRKTMDRMKKEQLGDS